MRKYTDYTGQKFGRLTVLSQVKSNSSGRRWLCQCECGNKTEVLTSNLTSGQVKSCGCLAKEIHSRRMKSIATHHGLSRTRIYGTWRDMKQRCNNPKSVPYPYYGAKGIKVCDEWNGKGESGFLPFYEWAKSNGYDDTLTLDRINPDLGYSPSNCRWVDWYEQNVHLTKSPSISSGYYGVSKHTNHSSYYGRVKVYGKCTCTGSANNALDAAIMRDKYILEHHLHNKLNGVVV